MSTRPFSPSRPTSDGTEPFQGLSRRTPQGLWTPVAGGGGGSLLEGIVIGDELMGGFFAGIIDTTRDNIIGTDAYQSGERYALIVAPESLEAGRYTETGDPTWHSSGSQSPAGAKTRWDGLSATAALAGSAYEAAAYCRGLSVPADGGSDWYLPALDELELVWRNLKPNTTNNYTPDGTGHSFPDDPLVQGVNPSSDPDGDAYTTGDPAQTDVTDFQDSGDEALSSSHNYWTSTWASSSSAWRQGFNSGGQFVATQTANSFRVRPVRRVAL